MVLDVGGPAAGIYPSNLAAVDGLVYFTGYDETDGYEPWVSDGTENGTFEIGDVYDGFNPGIYPNWFAGLDGNVLFEAYSIDYGAELFKWNGSAVTLVRNINTAGGGFASSEPSWITALGNKVYFQAWTGLTAYPELYESDGTSGGTHLTDDIDGSGSTGSYPEYLTVLDDVLYLFADDGTHGQELMYLDGDQAVLVKNINTGGGDADAYGLIAADGALYFFATDSSGNPGVWISDGSNQGTYNLSDAAGIPPVYDGCYSKILGVVDGKVVFLGDTDDDGYDDLWVTDGTEEGTERIEGVRACNYQ
jgi:ELWxxDGT repeat protein